MSVHIVSYYNLLFSIILTAHGRLFKTQENYKDGGKCRVSRRSSIERRRNFSLHAQMATRSRIHERTISLRFRGIILRVLRLEVSAFKAYITNQFQPTFARGGGGIKPVIRSAMNSKEEKDFCSNYVKEFGLCTDLHRSIK